MIPVCHPAGSQSPWPRLTRSSGRRQRQEPVVGNFDVGQLGVIKKMRARKVPTPMKDKDRHRGDASKAVQRKIVVFHAAVTFGAALRWFTEDC